MKAINIEWAVDDKSELWDLPTEIEIPEDIEGDDDAISGYLSDMTGYCHLGFSLDTDE